MYTKFGLYETSILGLLCQASGVATKVARCKKAAGDRRVFFDAPDVFRTRWLPLKQTGRAKVWIDVHVVAGSRNFFSLSFRIKGSCGIYPPPRPYANMSFDSYPALIFKFRPLAEQDDSQPQEGKGI